ncbi:MULTISPECIES: hypothetical protein [Thalassotalea]|uniref:Adhesin domain-containing protein n=1 Tax=Thalassotalea castellviae TaxID=3075612 RepID=A0ABU2ZXR2_9GAMM|nr:hypothetical protein [Thalassotalea sp. W431]MDT0602725.1 hypothetical protein [Thalassotalea sp. W431]
MKHIKIISAITLTTLMSGCVVIASSPSRADFHMQKELSIDASELTALDIETGSGSLSVIGNAELTEIRVTADIYTDKKYTDNYELTLNKSGNSGYFVAKNHSTSGFWVGDSPHIDVVIQLPKSMSLTIDDGSGDIDVQNLNGQLDIKDGSGGLLVKDINGDININDGSGEIDVSQITGNLKIIDGSGEINIHEIKGNLNVDDGSGTIYASNIDGSADFDDGSGDLTVKEITGMVTIDDGSGSITVDNAGGLKILESGSGGLKVKNVKGGFNIDS